MIKPITIDLSHRWPDTKLYARLVWQELFNIYEAGGGDLQYLDSFLCDLYSLKEAFDKGDFILYWYFTDQGYTSLLGYHEPGFYAYEIRYNIDQKTITITAL